MTCMLISAITTAYLEWKGEGEGEWKRVRAGQLTIYISYRIMQPRIVSPRPLFWYADNLNTENIWKCTHLWRGACDQTVDFLSTMEDPRNSITGTDVCVHICEEGHVKIRWHLQRHIESFVHMTCMLISAITTAYLEWKGEGEGEWKRVRAGQLTIYISYRIMQPRIVSPRPLFLVCGQSEYMKHM